MAYIQLSLALLITTLSLAGSLTFLITHPDNQNDALRLFNICWVAMSGAVFWLVLSIILVKLVRRCTKSAQRAMHSNHIGDSRNTSEQRLFTNSQPVPSISLPVSGSFIRFQAEPPSSMPSIVSSNPSPPETPTPQPPGSSRFSKMLSSPQLPELPSIFSPFQFHPPDDRVLYPQHNHPARSESLVALLSAKSLTETITSPTFGYTAFSAAMEPPRTPSPISRCSSSSMASATGGSFTVSPLLSDRSSPTKITTSSKIEVKAPITGIVTI